ncbi:P-loop NTPase family protein [Nesterenkonia ebinurensis]|uniref:hypothetical protein n=1 Tax=Nesterenkonia ebinurensis TaxID=2608252 RepID=UPI00123D0B83|nr:hypothetical protein [Nesterenkonia ebinurensis]
MAKRLSGILGVSRIELDARFWGLNWTEASSEELSEKVRQATSAHGGAAANYQGKLGTFMWAQADPVVWVNP